MTESNQPPQSPGSYPAPPQGYYPPPKKSHTLRNVLLILLLLFILGIGGCMALVGGAVNSVSKSESKVHHVTYTVTGSGTKADIMFDDGDGSSSEANGATLPWHKSLNVKGSFNFLSVIATSDFSGKGKIKCEIKVDGKVVKTATGSGALATANCNKL